MKTLAISILISLLLFSSSFCFAQSSEAGEVLFTPIGRNFNEIAAAAKQVGYVLVNSDQENDGKTISYEFINKNKPDFGCELKFYSGSNKCYAAAFSLPLEMWGNLIKKFNHQGVRQGVYYHWKFPKDKYEIILSKDSDNNMFYLYITPLKV